MHYEEPKHLWGRTMSCDGWGVGDTCKAGAKLREALRKQGIILFADDEGEIRQIVDLVPHAHQVTIYWSRIAKEITIPEHLLEEIENLRLGQFDSGPSMAE